MSRRLLMATTVAVVCNVGAIVKASEYKPDGTGAATEVVRVSSQVPGEVIDFLKQDSQPSSDRTVLFAKPIDCPIQPAAMNLLPVGARRTIAIDPHEVIRSSEMPLVPLPPPVWTGAAGLVGLGVVRVGRRIRKALRS